MKKTKKEFRKKGYWAYWNNSMYLVEKLDFEFPDGYPKAHIFTQDLTALNFAREEFKKWRETVAVIKGVLKRNEEK